MQHFGLEVWSDDNFIVKEGQLALNYAHQPTLSSIVQKIREDGHKGPLLLRFPHLIEKEIVTLFDAFKEAMETFKYQGGFHAVFPLKVNQFPNFVHSLMRVSKRYGYGLEAGSKAELIIAISETPLGAPITINGFKDEEMISICFIAAKMGHAITITIEGLGELQTIIEVNREFNRGESLPVMPNIGVRIRLHSSGVGIWAKSSGYSSKFGLTSTELLEAFDLMQQNDILGKFSMLHFHIGSQMSEISPLKKALREAGNIYADLKKRGALELKAINIGGGLAVEYSQHGHTQERDYSLREFANDVIFLMQEIADGKGVEVPDIFTESGRYIAASHSVLITPVLELFSQEYHENGLRPKVENPPLIEELYDLYHTINRESAREYLHDALDHMESLLTLFDLGYIDLEDRSNTEILVDLIIKKAIFLLKDEDTNELKRLQNRIQEKYLANFSTFESLPDFWGLSQRFPVVPLTHLDKKPSRPASICDITCDSDGEIAFDPILPLHLHDIDVTQEEYFLAFFLTGAYQEVLGMKHNLFTHPTEVIVRFDEEGNIHLDNLIEAQNLMEILDDLDYKTEELKRSLREKIAASDLIDEAEKRVLFKKLYLYLSENSYLKTIQASRRETRQSKQLDRSR